MALFISLLLWSFSSTVKEGKRLLFAITWKEVLDSLITSSIHFSNALHNKSTLLSQSFSSFDVFVSLTESFHLLFVPIHFNLLLLISSVFLKFFSFDSTSFCDFCLCLYYPLDLFLCSVHLC